jgi:ethanolamine ammonia-lyase small subunit
MSDHTLNRHTLAENPQTSAANRVAHLQSQTPARVFRGQTGPAYRTATLLELRADHAAARDAVHDQIDLNRDFNHEFIARWCLFETQTLAKTKQDFLANPPKGRAFDPASKREIQSRRSPNADLQLAIGDGLSATAVRIQVPPLLDALKKHADARAWTLGAPFFIRHCRVGILNEIGDLLHPSVVVLLIGERPGLATSQSLSAYLAFQPRPGDNDSRRNVISNIHPLGVDTEEAAIRIANLANQMRHSRQSGVDLKESLPAAAVQHSLDSNPPSDSTPGDH